jgi:hypothetical protein
VLSLNFERRLNFTIVCGNHDDYGACVYIYTGWILIANVGKQPLVSIIQVLPKNKYENSISNQ